MRASRVYPFLPCLIVVVACEGARTPDAPSSSSMATSSAVASGATPDPSLGPSAPASAGSSATAASSMPSSTTASSAGAAGSGSLATEEVGSSGDTGGYGSLVSAEAETSVAMADSSSASDTRPTSESQHSDQPLSPITVYVAGDSTVSTYRDTASTTDQAGWGQMLHEYLSELALVDNRAVGGTTSRSFIDFGHFDAIAQDIAAGDVLLVQFGTNDGNKTATYELDGQEIPYYLDPATDYKTYLARYVDLAESKGANLVFVTPPPRNSAYCTGGNGTGGHAQAMRELAAQRDVALADLNTRSVDYLTAICPAPTPEDFFLLRADGSVDGTHFQENGARILARFVAEEVAASESPLARYVTPPEQ